MEKKENKSIINEISVCFGNKLYRGNRISKINAEYFNAFSSENYPALAEIGINIHYKPNYFLKKTSKTITFNTNLDNNIAILKIFPGISPQYVESIINIKNLKAIIIETYGAGNAPTEQWFIDELERAINKGLILINVTQCRAGSVNQGKYETSLRLQQMGVLSAKDMTLEATLTKLMHLLGNNISKLELSKTFKHSISGELSD